MAKLSKIGMYSLAFALLVLGLSSCEARRAPAAIDGHIDLSDQDLSAIGPLQLRGDWNMYWERFIDPPVQAAELPGGALAFEMPHSWNEWKLGEAEVGGIGYASFSLDIRLPDGLNEIALWIPNASTAYTLYANGNRVAGNGVPGTTASTSVPHYRMSKAVVPVIEGHVLLVLHVSNFHHRRGGAWKPLRLGTVAQIEELNSVETMYDFLLLGNFLALGFYNLFLYGTSNKRPTASMLLSVLFWVLALRVLVLGQMLITQLIPSFPWAAQLKIEYLTSHAVPVLIVWIVDRLSPGKLDRRVSYAITIFAALNALVMLVSPVLFYSKIVFTYLIGLLVGLAIVVIQFFVNLVKGDKSALMMIGVISLTLFVVFGESVHNWELILSRDFAPFGFILGLFSNGSTVHTSAYLVTTIFTILVFFVAANLLALTASRKALVLQERNRQPLDMDQLRLEFKITNRESELVALVIEGLSNKEIGEKLFISEGTVKNHLHSIMRKIGVRNRTELSTRVRSGSD